MYRGQIGIMRALKNKGNENYILEKRKLQKEFFLLEH